MSSPQSSPPPTVPHTSFDPSTLPRYPLPFTPPISPIQVATLITTVSFLPGLTSLLHTLIPFLPSSSPSVLIFHTINPLPPSFLTNPFITSHCTLLQIPPLSSPQNPQNWCYSKLHLFSPHHYPPGTENVLYIDADCILLLSPFPYLQDLITSSEYTGFAASPDIFPPDRFNAGLMLFKLNENIGNCVLQNIDNLGTYDNGDTGYLNRYLPNYYKHLNRLPFKFNCQRVLSWLTSEDGGSGYWRELENDGIVVLHMSSTPKPWDEGARKGEIELKWWEVYTHGKNLRRVSASSYDHVCVRQSTHSTSP
ncbi:hypothetical protein TL16_g12345 [Triparma laevis f. inornata]|uniref:Uncharacterized protein n=1 Tax=Triparma laevis f. inornata TaxID=1714386 RepID=A0A9W7BTZ8_9STRA|nr:hypothetical protein TL16_g12345 [Triparma laevis f. inornata]